MNEPILIKWWAAFVRGGARKGDTGPNPQLYMINLVSLLSVLSLLVFGILQIVAEGDWQLGFFELGGAIAITVNLIGLRLTRNAKLARSFLLVSVLVLLMGMLMTGGTQGTGIFWFFVYPVIAFFLAGKRQGSYWMGALVATTLVMLVLRAREIVHLPYEPIVIRQLVVSLVVVSIGVFAYQYVREKAEQRLRAERQELAEAKNEFLALASHQLRTPISAIAWLAEMMLNGDADKLTETQADYVRQIYASNQRSVAVVDAIVTVSDLQAGTLRLHLETIHVDTLCKETIKKQLAVGVIAHANQLEIKEKYAAGVPAIRADLPLMRTIVHNLLSNAFKYTPPGGKVTVVVDKVSDKLIRGSRGSLRIVVSDTGYGIPKGQQSKIFAKLFRASNVKDKDTDGTGLGLYIVRSILERVGGRISFESTENEGSVFTVLLPLEGMRMQEGKKV